MDTIMEDDSSSFDSNTDAIVNGDFDDSGSGESMISGPNIPSSSSSSNDDDRHHQEQQMISTAAPGDDVADDLTTISSCASSSWFTNNNKKQNDQEAIMIFNVDFRALSQVDVRDSYYDEVIGNFKPEIMNIEQIANLNSCEETVREGVNEATMKDDVRTDQIVDPFLPSSWPSSLFLKLEDVEAPPLNWPLMTYNVAFKALSSSEGSFCNKSDNEVGKLNLNSCGKRVREGENEDEVILRKKDRSKEQMVDPLSPLNWSSFWEQEDDEGIFEVPPLSPLSPHPNLK